MKFISFIVWTAIFILTMCLHVAQHEQTHKQIAYYHGCLNGTITYGIDSYFICNKYEQRSEWVEQQEYSLHSINEIVGYSLDAVFFIVYSTFSIHILTRKE
jgi:hypothetical protein